MSEFSEDQRIVIRALAAEQAARQFEGSAELHKKIDALVGDKLPRLCRLEKWIGTWYGLAALLLAIPFVPAGVTYAVKTVTDAGLRQEVKQELEKEDGPIKSSLRRFSAFNGRLANQFAQNVDSATTKLLTFGCNLPSPSTAIQGFPACVPLRGDDVAAAQARNQQEADAQTIFFKRNKGQSVLLRVQLSPIDDAQVLRQVGLQLLLPPLLDQDNANASELVIDPKDLPDTQRFVDKSGLLKLYGAVSLATGQEPLRADIDITRHLPDGGDLHALRFAAKRLPQAAAGRGAGSERFYLRAVVVVTHNLPKE